MYNKERGMENWKKLVYGTYEISDLGRLRNTRSGKFLATDGGQRCKYIVVQLSSFGIKKMFYLHVLVANAFLGPCPYGKEVNHKDGVKRNCMVKNLEYTTHVENMKHAVNHGLVLQGSDRKQSKLNEKIVQKIRSLRGVVVARKLALKYGVAKITIEDVWQRKSWKHI